jgi:hypothetical protein
MLDVLGLRPPWQVRFGVLTCALPDVLVVAFFTICPPCLVL